MLSCPRCTPSAPAQRAISARSFTKSFAPYSAVSFLIRYTTLSNSLVGKSFSLSCTALTPAFNAPSMAAKKASSSGNSVLSVIKYSLKSIFTWPIDYRPPLKHPLQRAARGCVELSSHSPGFISQPSGNNCMLHRSCHCYRVFGCCNGSIYQHRIATKLHCNRCIGGGTDSRIDQNRDFRGLEDYFYVVGIPNTQPRAYRRSERHHCRSTCIFEPSCHYWVIVSVWEYNEALFCEYFRCL